VSLVLLEWPSQRKDYNMRVCVCVCKVREDILIGQRRTRRDVIGGCICKFNTE
jgi:hypothetical protein